MKLYIDKNLNIDKNKAKILAEFCIFCADKLPIEGDFEVKIVSDREPHGILTTAAYHLDENKCAVYGKNRALVDVMRSIVKSKQAKNLKFKDGTMKCDLMTASVITQVYDKVNDSNKAKLKPMMNGKKADFLKLQNIAFKVAK